MKRELYERYEEGQKALNLNEALSPYLESMRDECHRKFESCPIRDSEGMQLIRLQLQSIEWLRKSIRAIIEDGQIARVEIDESKDPIR